jgi:DNA-binding response OmpR family regulator
VIARAASVAGAADLVSSSEWSLAIVDHELPDGFGLEILDVLRANNPSMPIVMLTCEGSEETAVEAFRRGASDYLVKGGPYTDALEIRIRALVAA